MEYTDLQIRNLRILGDRVKDCYCSAYKSKRPMWKLNESKWGDEFWFSVAEVVSELKVSPQVFVDCAFDSWNHIPKPPNMLKASSLRSEFDEIRKNARENAEEIVTMSTKLFRRYVEVGIPIDKIITDPTVYFNDFMRYVFAVHFCPDLVDTYLGPARAFLVEFPVFQDLATQLVGEEDALVQC